jgi:glycine/D-amino acid oxidase-like deaminating enzyme
MPSRDDLPDDARVVIIGAGIVGCSAAYHLTRLGWKDIVVLDQGPLFEAGGSTSHAPGMVFENNAARTTCHFAMRSVDVYRDLKLNGESLWTGSAAWRSLPHPSDGRSSSAGTATPPRGDWKRT